MSKCVCVCVCGCVCVHACGCVRVSAELMPHALTLAGRQIHMSVSEGHSSSTVQSGCCSDTE